MATSTPDLSTVKQRQQQVWSEGDFSLIAIPLVVTSELLCESIELHGGERVLDIATGSGNTAIAAARRNTNVAGTDYVPALVDRARERAQAERLDIEFRVGDAEDIDFPDAAFDVVLSTFGVMFAPDHHQAASELIRVTRPGGRIGLVAWTPEGRIGELFRLVAEFNPPPPNVTPPLAWGTEEHLQELLGDNVSSMNVERRIFRMVDRSPSAWLEFFRSHFGPMHHAFGMLDETGKQTLEQRLIDWANSANTASDGSLVIPCEYMEVIATRRDA